MTAAIFVAEVSVAEVGLTPLWGNAIPDTRAWFASRSEAEATETHSDSCWRDIRREAEQSGADRDPYREAALYIDPKWYKSLYHFGSDFACTMLACTIFGGIPRNA